jgi:hypothetical protein
VVAVLVTSAEAEAEAVMVSGAEMRIILTHQAVALAVADKLLFL